MSNLPSAVHREWMWRDRQDCSTRGPWLPTHRQLFPAPEESGEPGASLCAAFLQQLIRPATGQAGSPLVKPEPVAVQISMPVQGLAKALSTGRR